MLFRSAERGSVKWHIKAEMPASGPANELNSVAETIANEGLHNGHDQAFDSKAGQPDSNQHTLHSILRKVRLDSTLIGFVEM